MGTFWILYELIWVKVRVLHSRLKCHKKKMPELGGDVFVSLSARFGCRHVHLRWQAFLSLWDLRFLKFFKLPFHGRAVISYRKGTRRDTDNILSASL